ncbi:MAG: PEGA domain-containing protein [Vicinamibacterales bacterium]
MHQIGAGSVGPVFRGEDGETRQPVVIKAIRAGLPPERAAAMAAALAALRDRLPAHPSLVPLLGTGVVDDEPYAVSPVVDGDSLDVALRQYGPAHVVDALPRLRALADALDAAAALDIVHGSLHPRDILVSVERTVLTGTGIAPILERVGAAPPVRRPYTAPEVCDGGGSSAAADQYALAAIAYEWLTGRRLGPVSELAVRVAGLPQEDADELTAVFRRALDEDPAQRFSTASGFVEAVAIASASVAPAATRPATRSRRSVAPRLVFDEPDEGAAVEPAPLEAAGPPPPAPVPETSARDPLDLHLTMRPEHTALPPEWDGDSLLSAGAPADPDRTSRVEFDEGAGRPEPVAPPIEVAPTVAPPPPSRPSPSRTRTPAAPAATAAEAPAAGPSLPVAVAAFAAFVVLAFLGGWALLRWSTPRGTAPVASAPVAPATSQAPSPAESVPTASSPSAVVPAPEPQTEALAPRESMPSAPPAGPPRSVPSAASAAAPARRPATAAAGRLLVRSTPGGAEVFVNGTRRGVTPLTLRDVALGTYTVRVTRAGFASAEQRIVLDRARPARTVSLTLARERAAAAPAAAAPSTAAATGTFSFDTRPRGARVFVDGRRVGVTPVTVTVPAGAHAIRFEREGFQPITTTARVPARSGARVAVTLTPERR